MGSFRVDTDQMTSAVGNIKSAAQGTGSLKEMLDSVHARLGGAALSDDGDMRDKLDGFRDRWKEEFRIIGDMLDKFDEALTKASSAYVTTDGKIATSLQPQPGAPAEV